MRGMGRWMERGRDDDEDSRQGTKEEGDEERKAVGKRKKRAREGQTIDMRSEVEQNKHSSAY